MFGYRAIGNACRVLRKFSPVSCAFGNSLKSMSKQTSLLSRLNVASSSSMVSECRRFSTKPESTFVDFLKDEIEAEKNLGKQQLAGTKQPDIPDFQIKTEGREVVLTKQHGSEKIKVTFDINHTVDSNITSEDEGDKPPQQPEEPSQMVSKPNFSVEIEKKRSEIGFRMRFH